MQFARGQHNLTLLNVLHWLVGNTNTELSGVSCASVFLISCGKEELLLTGAGIQ